MNPSQPVEQNTLFSGIIYRDNFNSSSISLLSCVSTHDAFLQSSLSPSKNFPMERLSKHTVEEGESGEPGVIPINFRNKQAQASDALKEKPRASAAHQVPEAPISTARRMVRQCPNGASEDNLNYAEKASRSTKPSCSNTPGVNPQKEPIDTTSESITNENKENLKLIVELLIEKISNLGSRRLRKKYNFEALHRALTGQTGVLFLQSVREDEFEEEVEHLFECLQKIELWNIFNKGSSGENLELAVDLVKKLIARPGQVPTNAVALTLVNELKTPEGRAFLRELSKVTVPPINRVWFDMLKLACEFLCASQFEIEEVSRKSWNYNEPLVQRLVKAFASNDGFKAFKFFFFSDQYAGVKGRFLKDYLKSKLLSKQAFSMAICSNSGTTDAIFDALWTKPGLYFILACTNQKNVPKPWLKRLNEPCILDVITTSGDCLKTRYHPYFARYMRASPLCPGWQEQFFQIAYNDIDLVTSGHVNTIYNNFTYHSITPDSRSRAVLAAHLNEVMSIIKSQSDYLKATLTKTQNFIKNSCRALVSMKNGDNVAFQPRQFFELAEKWEQGYRKLVEQNIACLVNNTWLGDLKEMTPEAHQELTAFNTKTETSLLSFLKTTRYMVHVLEGGRLYFEVQRNAGHETSIGDAIFLMNGASSAKNIKSTVASVQNNLLIYEDNIRHSTRDLKFSRYLNERLINEFLMTWSEELLGETSPLLDWVGDAEIAQLRTWVFWPGRVCYPYTLPFD
ncbi:hypothetical protein PUMCH_001545 [Australozyma saopauloensis]|uniref:Uncharacterized protein n=1 Tax=Australozyma saopauloensis TaxID=291208 RepID=A0AAX4H6V9_9ASCO|nr:hypothetical protein PUMCH_001545 [[Candida] saopauloensis]